MKSLPYTAIALLLITGFAMGQITDSADFITNTDSKVWKRAPENYLRGLQRDNLGVVESAMLNLMKLKAVYPEGNYKNVSIELDRLQAEGKTKSIRFMAYITYNYLKNPDRFTWLNQNDLTAMDSTLAIMSTRLKTLGP